MEEKICFPSGELELEGLYNAGQSNKGVVVTHPHPLYGGDMYNPVVEAITTAYGKLDFSTLRFNFRGVRKSAGDHDFGAGESADVAAAIEFLKEKNIQRVHLSGYSFGAWVNAMAMQGSLTVDGMTMVAPPVAFIQFKEGIHLPMLSLIVAGSRDEFAPPTLIAQVMEKWNSSVNFDVIDGADHFFFSYLDEVTRRLVEGLRSAG